MRALRRRYGRARAGHGWSDWAAFADRPDFIAWASPPPRDPFDPAGMRYAVVRYNGRITWVRVFSDPGLRVAYSPSSFDDDVYGDGIAAAGRSALLHKRRMAQRTSSRSGESAEI